MKKLLFKFLIILSFTSLNSISAYSAVATGLATTYKLTITKMELCETGSTAANCLNPVTVSLPGIGTALDIAAVTAGETAGTIGNFGLATPGTAYTYIQTTMSRAIVVAGTVGDCTTKADKNGTAATNVAKNTSKFSNTFLTILSVLLIKFNWPLSLIGFMLLLKNDAFSLLFGFVAQFQ